MTGILSRPATELCSSTTEDGRIEAVERGSRRTYTFSDKRGANMRETERDLDSAYITRTSIAGNLTPSYDKENAEECIEHADSICSAARQALSL